MPRTRPPYPEEFRREAIRLAQLGELVNRRTWPTRLELQSAVFEYIKAFYNRQRRHSTSTRSPPSPKNSSNSRRSTVEINRSNNNHQQQIPCHANRGRSAGAR